MVAAFLPSKGSTVEVTAFLCLAHLRPVNQRTQIGLLPANSSLNNFGSLATRNRPWKSLSALVLSLRLDQGIDSP
jgi:hypothetical protein